MHAARPLVRDILPEIVEALPAAVAILAVDGSTTYRNRAWERLFGRTDSALTVEPGRADPIARALERGQGVTALPHLVRGQDGSPMRVSLTVTPMVDDAGAVAGAIAHVDLAPAELGLGAFREAFLGVLSHELRTPITSIYGGAQLLLNDDLSVRSRAEVLSDIAAEAERLHRRVEDFLAVARIERGSGARSHDPIQLARLVRHVVAVESRRSPHRRLVIRGDRDLPTAVGDETHVAQVIRNLLANASDRSPAGRPVAIDLEATGESVEVVVKDRGPGFPKDIGDDAFSLFYRNPQVAESVPGSGLGLYVARALIEANNGHIWLRDRRGGGTEVGFSLPTYPIADDD